MTQKLAVSSTPCTGIRGTVRLCRRGKNGSTLLVAVSRESVKNALNDDVYLDIIDILDKATVDSSIAAVVLTGAGSFFSSGADVNDGHFEVSKDGMRQSILHKPGGRFMMAVVSFPKILCAAVNGPIIGIAATALLQCDLVHFSDSAFFWAPFTRLALVPELTSSISFLESMGLSKANELLLLGRRIDAKTALEYNICSRVVSDCDKSGDPFHPNSLASRMCAELDKRLLSLPRGEQTAHVFTSLVKGPRRARMEQALLRELKILDERFHSGEVLDAAKQLMIGSKKTAKSSSSPRSRL